MTRLGLVCLLTLLNACAAGWRRMPDLGLGPFPRRQQAQIWHGGRSERWHGLNVTVDSVSGVRFTEDPGCEGCRLSLPRTEIDSVRIGNPETGFLKTAGLIVGIPIVLGVIICGGPSEPCSGE